MHARHRPVGAYSHSIRRATCLLHVLHVCFHQSGGVGPKRVVCKPPASYVTGLEEEEEEQRGRRERERRERRWRRGGEGREGGMWWGTSKHEEKQLLGAQLRQL